MSPLKIAEIAHEISRAVHPDGFDSWANLSEQHRRGIVFGALFILKKPDVTAEWLHRVFFAQLVESGYRYGETIDPIKKTHPVCLPYAELTPLYRAKLNVFVESVRHLSRL